MKLLSTKLYILVISLLFFVGCEDNASMKNKELVNNIDLKLDANHINILNTKKIFFGHQSVGINILDGISQLSALNPELKIDIKKTMNPESVSGSAFMHSVIGENENPLFKIQEFEKIVNSSVSEKLDIAFFKFCYLDVNKNTDVDQLFNEYEAATYRLIKAHPDTVFVHFTVPLTRSETNLRSMVKQLLGKPDNNIARAVFNKKIIDKFGKSGRVFDLAYAESTYPDGSRSSFISDGVEYYSLAPEYASDNGHLNELGAIVVGKALLNYLANL